VNRRKDRLRAYAPIETCGFLVSWAHIEIEAAGLLKF